MSLCFHCGLPNPSLPWSVTVLGGVREVCCPGCQAVAESIEAQGLSDYYLSRDQLPDGRYEAAPMELLERFDHPSVQQAFVYHEDQLACAELALENISCSACGWLIERRLSQEPSVVNATVNYSNHRLRIQWDEQQQKLSQLLHILDAIGYRARPFRHDTQGEQLKQQARHQLARVALAGLGTMQAMMFSLGLYLGAFDGMEHEYRDYLRWVSGLVATPVFFYAGWPFYRAATQAIRARHLTMDVPVSIALIFAFTASWWATVSQSGETYFDSVCMFIFFLQSSRFIELKARQQAAEQAASLLTIKPRLIKRWSMEQQQWQLVASETLSRGDKLLIESGDTLPCDVTLDSAQAHISEAMLTGEPKLVHYQRGATLLAGSVNGEQAAEVTVLRLGQDTLLANLEQLMSRALAEKPKTAQAADRLAHWFVLRVLVLAALVYAGWYWVDPSHAFWATLAVLVATCPCALSLATPTALTLATQRLAGNGFLITRGHVLDTLASCDRIVFDKTGTLTEGHLQVVDCQSLADTPYDECLALIAGLEQGSSHPLARALLDFTQQQGQQPTLFTSAATHVAGGGMVATQHGVTYRLGHARFALTTDGHESGDITLWLSADYQPIARITLADRLRPSAEAMIRALRERGIKTTLLSGDVSQAPELTARRLNIDSFERGLSPEQKQARIAAWQAAGETVCMVGDGINDAASLAQSHVGIAMGSGTDWAQTRADAVLLGDRLAAIAPALALAQACQRIIQQNMRWAVGYNLAVLPPAALGFVPPWLAALGMSLSSLIVVFNARRLRRVTID